MAGEVILWLQAVNKPAHKIIEYNTTVPRTFPCKEEKGCKLLQVGLPLAPKCSGRVLSVGRGPYNDVLLEGLHVSNDQCYLFLQNSALILRDVSSNQNTQIKYLDLVGDKNHLLQGRPKQAVLLTGRPILLQIYSAQFRIIWPILKEQEIQSLKTAMMKFEQEQVLNLTVLDLQSLQSTACETRSRYTPSVDPQYLREIRHQEVRKLGDGKFGTVHETRDLFTGEVLAVKTCKRPLDIEYRRSLKREVEILAGLTHPNIVRLKYSQGWGIGSRIEVFLSPHDGDLVKFVTLPGYNRKCGEEPSFWAQFLEQILPAVKYLHGKKIVHRDIKPSNCLYDFNGPGGSLNFYISDFGLSRILTATSEGSLDGTLVYMAPEIIPGNSWSQMNDIWSIAVLLLWLLGYFNEEDFYSSKNKWKHRMEKLPGYQPQFTFEDDSGPDLSLSHSAYQIRWYGRLRSLVRNGMIRESVEKLLEEDPGRRPDIDECIALLCPGQHIEQCATEPEEQQPSFNSPVLPTLSAKWKVETKTRKTKKRQRKALEQKSTNGAPKQKRHKTSAEEGLFR